jgi:hypothetical protein
MTSPSTADAGTPAQEPPANAPTTTPAPAAAPATTEPAPATETAGKTFTQADLDRLINDRLQRAEQSWTEKQAEERRKLAAALGIEDPSAPLDPAKALEDERAGRTAEQQRADRAEVRALALAAGVKKDRVAAFARLVDVAGALEGVDRSDEKAVTDALDKAVAAELDATPEFKGATLPSSSGGDRSGGGTQTVTLEQFKKMDIGDRQKLYQTNKGLYQQLSAQERAEQ